MGHEQRRCIWGRHANILHSCRLDSMRLALLLVSIAAGILPAPHANARNHSAASGATTLADGSTSTATPAHENTIAVANADDSLKHWSTCAQPECYPGGKGVPVSTSQTIDNASPSVDGASMLLTETANSTTSYTNVLWPYKMKGCDACTHMRTNFWAYPVSSSHVASLEYDAFLFDAAHQLNIMWGVQWNQRAGKWQIWNQGTSQWVDTMVTTGPRFGVWNHLQFSDHRVIGDTSCGGTECLYYDTLMLNGTTYALNLTEPAGPLHHGWGSVSGFQFQLDATPVASGSATLSEYIDEADMWAN